VVENGDTITIDVLESSIHLHVPDEQIAARLKAWKQPTLKVKKGYLALYSRLASSADKGAIIRYPGS
jgi:dihydroxy-acid dehydratase